MASCGQDMAQQLKQLSLQQLSQLKEQLDQELSLFQHSMQNLRMAQSKFKESENNIEKLSPKITGKQIFVPLNSSVYVPGRIIDAENVMLDIGAGYYVEKDLEGTKDYFKRKIEFVTEEIEKIQAISLEKSALKDLVMEAFQLKLQTLNVEKS